jgi:Na+/H+-dicarboxylate symporter
MERKSFLRSYAMTLILVGAILAGSLAGWLLGARAAVLKAFGDVFLNALFVTVVPLVFFSISSAVAAMAGAGRLVRILGWMMAVFIITGVISSLVMVAGVQLYPPSCGPEITTKPAGQPATQSASQQAPKPSQRNIGDKIVQAVSVPDFVKLLSRDNMLALIVFAALVGLAAGAAGERGRAFTAFLQSANEVMMKVISFIMYYAPVGLAAYFAYLIGQFGTTLLGAYARSVALYYPLCIAYFLVAFTAYAALAGRLRGVGRFWSNIIPASVTAAATASSFATIPVNLEAADRIGVPRDISEVVIPIGATIHMDGSCMSAVLKIAFLFSFYHMPFAGAGTIATAIGVSILSGMVMSGIPGGGAAGEMLIVTIYGFPPEALGLIIPIGQLVDPPATMVNAIGDNVASMLVARIMGGRNWMPAAAGSR